MIVGSSAVGRRVEQLTTDKVATVMEAKDHIAAAAQNFVQGTFVLIHYQISLYFQWAVGQHMSPKVPFPVRDVDPTYSWFFGPTRVCPNQIASRSVHPFLWGSQS